MKTYLEKYMVLLAIACFLTLNTANADTRRAFEVDDDLVREYLDEVYNTTEATKLAPPSRDEFQSVVSQAVPVFEENIKDEGYDTYVTDNDLTHFIDEGRRNRQHESQFSCGTYECYRQKYRLRHNHVQGCHICNGLSRMWFRYANIQPIAFYPAYAYYNGARLNTYRDNVYYRNQICPVSFDYDDREWTFGYQGRSYPLYF
ncbi:MAG: hypothetical protein ACOH5I_19880 [Oligoflexus sp.]